MTDAGRHPRIKLLTLSEIEQIGGYFGNFTVRVRQRARYVREKDCTACGDWERLAEAHAKRPFTWVVDPKGVNFPHYRRASLVKPNLIEAAAASGVETTDEASLRRAGRALLARWEAGAVLISRGEDGITLFRQGGAVRTFPTAAREVFDVTGAGDTVVATCALELGAGGSPEDATLLANHAAGLVVGKVGTASVTGRELLAALAEG